MELTGLLERAWSIFSPWLGSTVAVIATALVVIVTRFLLDRAGADRRGVPYQRQIASTLIVLVGIMMRLSRSYRPGDFIEVGDIVGRVTDQGLFHTDVQLITRDMVALPNLYLSRNPVHVTRASSTFVAADVSLGYELPQREEHDRKE